METVTLDSSQLVEFCNCPKAYAYRYSRHLIPIGIDQSALTKGSLMHALLERFYTLRKNNVPHLDALSETIRAAALLGKDYDLPGKMQEFLLKRFTEYVLFYKEDNFDVLETEKGFSVPILDNNEFLFVVEGRLDLIIRIRDQILWMDHKTQSRAATLYNKKVQFSIYTLATGRMGMVNYLRLHDKVNYENSGTFQRSLISLTLERQKAFQTWLIAKIHQFVDALHNGFSRDFSRCSGPFDSNPCPFITICENPTVEEAMIEKHYQIRQEPWKAW